MACTPFRWHPEPLLHLLAVNSTIHGSASTLAPRTVGGPRASIYVTSAPCVAAWKLAILSNCNPCSPESPREIQAPQGSLSPTPSKACAPQAFLPSASEEEGPAPRVLPLFRASSCQASASYPDSPACLTPGAPAENQPESSLWWACPQALDKVGVPHHNLLCIILSKPHCQPFFP